MSDGELSYDVIVIGGGPAGLMASYAAATAGAHTALLEKGNRLGRKLGISGGGRCNVTNAKPLPELMENIPGNGRFMHSALNRFSNREVIRFFEGLGIALKEEDRGRVFPVSDKAATVVKALVDAVYESGVDIFEDCQVKRVLSRAASTRRVHTNTKVDGNRPDDGRDIEGVLLADGRTVYARAIVIAAGGASVPKTGSTGDAYPWARQLGHTVITPYPTEVPLTSDEPFIQNRSLQGLSLRGIDISIILLNKKGKRLTTETGDLLFTHLGLSGPAALRCSHYVSTALRRDQQARLAALIDLVPHTPLERLQSELRQMKMDEPKKHIHNVLPRLVPERLVDVLLDMCDMETGVPMSEVKHATLDALARQIKQFPVSIRGTLPLSQATVTGGGVSVKEIDPRTMASKLCSGLFFAGEVMDVHAHTGGYNITVAFSSGHLAGQSAAQYALS